MAPPKAEALARGGLLTGLRRVGGALLRLSRPVAALPLAGWAALLWYASSQPPPAVPDPWSVGLFVGNCGHAFAFGILALLVALTLPRAAGWPRLDARGIALALVAVGVYAVVDELHQGLTPGRNPAVPDVVTDLCGAACTLWIAAYVARPDATDAGLARRLALGVLACLACGALASVLPALFPDVGWL